MSWGTQFKADVFIRSVNIESKYQAESMIGHLRDDINNYITDLKMLAISRPKDIIPEDEKDNPFYWISSEVTFKTDEILDNQKKITLLELYLESLEPPYEE